MNIPVAHPSPQEKSKAETKKDKPFPIHMPDSGEIPSHARLRGEIPSTIIKHKENNNIRGKKGTIYKLIIFA